MLVSIEKKWHWGMVWLLAGCFCMPLAAQQADVEAAAAQPSNVTQTARLEVKITGLEGPLLDNAKAYLELYQKKDQPELSAVWIRHLHHKAAQEIQRALQPFGYYAAKVEGKLQERDDGQWIASYHVEPGPPVTLSQVDVQWAGDGAEEAELQAALRAFPLHTGDVLNHAAYEKAKDALIEQADALGYPDVHATEAKILVDPKKNKAVIRLHLNTGKKYFISAIRLQQNALDPEFIRRYLVDVKPGDVYSQDKLLAIQKDLIDSGYFSLVDVNPRFQQAQAQQVPVDVTLNPAKRQTYTFSVGYDTDIGVNLAARWQHRRLNKQGHKADAIIKLSPRESRIQSNYWIPIRDPRNNKLGFTARLESENTDTSARDTIDLEAGYYLLWRDWTTRFYSQLKYERFAAGSESTTDTTLWSLGAFAERSEIEEGKFPRRAWHLLSELQASPGWISSTSYVRAHVKSGVYIPFLDNGRFILRGELGASSAADFDKYPNSLRFFAGGDGSVRGYEWKALGPKDANGEVMGGKHLLTANLEYDHRVLEQWVAAAFVDAGNAFDDKLDKIYVGAGVGVRWLSPVGSVRLDFAWPMNDEQDDPQLSRLRLHFGFEVSL